MNRTFSQMIWIGLVLIVLGGCSTGGTGPGSTIATVAPSVVAQITLAPSATAVPPTVAATEIPPTAIYTPTVTQTALTPTATSLPPTATATPVPPTRTRTRAPSTATRPKPTATRRPPTAVPSKVRVEWLSNVTYESRDGNTRWCQIQMVYHNDSDVTLEWPAYQPVFVILNADGSIAHRYRAGYYSKANGWQNGIEGLPPPIPAHDSSFIWTWYSIAENNGQTCRFVYVTIQGATSAAEYDTQGTLINKNAVVPR